MSAGSAAFYRGMATCINLGQWRKFAPPVQVQIRPVKICSLIHINADLFDVLGRNHPEKWLVKRGIFGQAMSYALGAYMFVLCFGLLGFFMSSGEPLAHAK